MFVLKRNGYKQPVQFDKITARIVKLCYGLNTEFVDPVLVSQKVTAGARQRGPGAARAGCGWACWAHRAPAQACTRA